MTKNFLDISDADFSSIIQKNDLVLVDFWAIWCGPCIRFGEVIESLANSYKEQVLVCKLNIDQNELSPIQYGVQKLPTAIIFHKGVEAERILGYIPLESLQERLSKYLS